MPEQPWTVTANSLVAWNRCWRNHGPVYTGYQHQRVTRHATANSSATELDTPPSSTLGSGDSVLAAIDGFYASVVQELRPWAPRAPQLARRVETAVEAAGIDVTPPPQDFAEPDD